MVMRAKRKKVKNKERKPHASLPSSSSTPHASFDLHMLLPTLLSIPHSGYVAPSFAPFYNITSSQGMASSAPIYRPTSSQSMPSSSRPGHRGLSFSGIPSSTPLYHCMTTPTPVVTSSPSPDVPRSSFPVTSPSSHHGTHISSTPSLGKDTGHPVRPSSTPSSSSTPLSSPGISRLHVRDDSPIAPSADSVAQPATTGPNSGDYDHLNRLIIEPEGDNVFIQASRLLMLQLKLFTFSWIMEELETSTNKL